MKNYIMFSKFMTVIFIITAIVVFMLNELTTITISNIAYLILFTLCLINESIRLRYTRFILEAFVVSVSLKIPITKELYIKSLDICGLEYDVIDDNELDKSK